MRATIVVVRVPPVRVCARLRQLYVGARLPAGPKVAAVRDAATSYFLCVPLRPSIRASDTSNLPRRTSEALLRLRVTRGSCSCPHNSERSHAFILVNSGSALELRLLACLPRLSVEPDLKAPPPQTDGRTVSPQRRFYEWKCDPMKKKIKTIKNH